MFGSPKINKTETPDPASPATTADASVMRSGNAAVRRAVLNRSRPAFSTKSLVGGARVGRRSLLGGSNAAN